MRYTRFLSMMEEEFEVPKEIGEFIPLDAEVTVLGHDNGANKQYRYGNLHIREYDNKYLVHMDKVDPRTDPIGHLIYDAPEILVGIGCAILGGTIVSTLDIFNKSSIYTKIGVSLASGYYGYTVAKKIKDQLR